MNQRLNQITELLTQTINCIQALKASGVLSKDVTGKQDILQEKKLALNKLPLPQKQSLPEQESEEGSVDDAYLTASE